MENDYTKREIDHYIAEMKAFFMEHSKDDERNFRGLDHSIIALTDQVRLTNGKVKGLENWRYFLIGGLTVISLIVIPLVIYILKGVL